MTITLNGEVLFALGLGIQEVDPYGPPRVSRIDQHDAPGSLGGAALEHSGNQIPVRVDHAAAPSFPDILEDQVKEQGGFPDARKP